jgi:hypothetical protein
MSECIICSWYLAVNPATSFPPFWPFLVIFPLRFLLILAIYFNIGYLVISLFPYSIQLLRFKTIRNPSFRQRFIHILLASAHIWYVRIHTFINRCYGLIAFCFFHPLCTLVREYFSLSFMSVCTPRIFRPSVLSSWPPCRSWSLIQAPFYTVHCNLVRQPLRPELNPSAQRCLTRFFTGDFDSWTVHFVNICAKNQQMKQLFIQFIIYVW